MEIKELDLEEEEWVESIPTISSRCSSEAEEWEEVWEEWVAWGEAKISADFHQAEESRAIRSDSVDIL